MTELLAPAHIELIHDSIKKIMGEVIEIACKLGVDRQMLETEVDAILARTPSRDFKPSMLVDLEAGRPIELEAIIGEAVRKAAEFNVSVPRHATLLIQIFTSPSNRRPNRLELIYANLRIIQYKLRK